MPFPPSASQVRRGRASVWVPERSEEPSALEGSRWGLGARARGAGSEREIGEALLGNRRGGGQRCAPEFQPLRREKQRPLFWKHDVFMLFAFSLSMFLLPVYIKPDSCGRRQTAANAKLRTTRKRCVCTDQIFKQGKEAERVTRNPKIVGDKVPAKGPAGVPAWRVYGPTLSARIHLDKVDPLPGHGQRNRRYSNRLPRQSAAWERKRRSPSEEGWGEEERPGEPEHAGSLGRPSLKAHPPRPVLSKENVPLRMPSQRGPTPHSRRSQPDTAVVYSHTSLRYSRDTHTNMALWLKLFYTEIHMG